MTPVSGSKNNIRRPLLVHGEELTVPVSHVKSGGGKKFHPQSLDEALERLGPRITQMTSAALELPAKFRAPDRVYVEAKLLPNYLAPSYFPSSLLSQVEAQTVGSRAATGILRTRKKEEQSQTRTLILTLDDSGLKKLRELVDGRPTTRSTRQVFEDLRKFEDFSLPTPQEIMVKKAILDDYKTTEKWEVVLHPRTTISGEAVPLEESTLQRWYELVESYEGKASKDYVRTIGGLTFMPVRCSATNIKALAQFNPLRVIRPMPQLRTRAVVGASSSQKLSPPPSHNPRATDISVAVFDGGVDTSQAASSLFQVTTADLTPELPQPEDLKHGTGVTGAALYGLVAPGDTAPIPPLPVDSYRILPAPLTESGQYLILDQIREKIEDNNYKIVNLSFGPDVPVNEDLEPNLWTSELDRLAWENDVLFVVAAGNTGEREVKKGGPRVQAPADMVNGLSVGACDAPYPEKNWSRAPYSSQGPGRFGARVQPAGVQFGGVEGREFDLLLANGSFSKARGTSFATPLTTHALAELAAGLPRVNSNILRVFAVHFAQRHRSYRKLQYELGYGRQLLSYQESLNCASNEVHVLYTGEIQPGEIIGYKLPIGQGVKDKITVKITIAYTSPVDPTQSTEYTLSSLNFVVRPHRLRYTFYPPAESGDTTQVLNLGSDEARQLLEKGWKTSQEPVSQQCSNTNRDSSEAKLRESGKWETIRQCEFSLLPEAISDPRIELTSLARKLGGLDPFGVPIPFAILISVTGNKDETDLYDNVKARFKALVPAQQVPARIGIRSASPASSPHRWF